MAAAACSVRCRSPVFLVAKMKVTWQALALSDLKTDTPRDRLAPAKLGIF
jgi:hypothetical protein